MTTSTIVPGYISIISGRSCQAYRAGWFMYFAEVGTFLPCRYLVYRGNVEIANVSWDNIVLSAPNSSFSIPPSSKCSQVRLAPSLALGS